MVVFCSLFVYYCLQFAVFWKPVLATRCILYFSALRLGGGKGEDACLAYVALAGEFHIFVAQQWHRCHNKQQENTKNTTGHRVFELHVGPGDDYQGISSSLN